MQTLEPVKRNKKSLIANRLALSLFLGYSYLDAGYEYVNIDDCWSELERDENGKIIADKKRFPRGIKFLSNYVSPLILITCL
jgi:hypothetical protein